LYDYSTMWDMSDKPKHRNWQNMETIHMLKI